ncbi:MAG: hypothetical protein J6U73_00015 [Alistipes sp.]|nr:hypothetical protein [Alistipes sp.]
MRRIALYISLLLGAIGCSGSEDIGGNYHSIASLWSYVRRGTVQITEDIYLCGYVVANDKFGELNRAIVVADDSAGVVIEIDMDGIEYCYPLYSKVQIRCSGLWLGTIGPKLMLGAEPIGDFVVDRVPSSRVSNYITLLPENSDTPTFRRRRVAELGYRDMLNYIVVENLRLVDSEHGVCWTDNDPATGLPITTVRHFCQGGDTLRVVTAAESQYATEYIPTSSIFISGILDWYDGDIAMRIVGHITGQH